MIESDFKNGGTVSFKRQDVLDDPLEDMDEEEIAFVGFCKILATDPNIAGVAISRIQFGGIYTHFFVKERGRGDAMRRTIGTAADSFGLLELAAGDRAGYGGYIGLGSKTFDEVEKRFRKGRSRRERKDPFLRPPKSEELDLVMIAKFE